MKNNELFELVEKFNHLHPSTRQTTLFPDINNEDLNLVMELFPEYDPNEEVPLLFYHDGTNWDDTVRWFMLSNTRFYCKMFYYSHPFNVVDLLPLSGINSLVIKKNLISDNTLTINEHKIGSLILYSRREASYLNEIVGLILNNTEKEDIKDASICMYEKEYLPKGWENLENSQLFSVARDYFSRANIARRNWGFEFFYYGPYIPETILERTRSTYANYDTKEEVCLLLVENISVSRVGVIESSGFILTNKYLYYKLKPSIIDRFIIKKVPLNAIRNIKIKAKLLIGWLHLNKQKPLGLTQFSILTKRDAQALQEVMEKFIKALD